MVPTHEGFAGDIEPVVLGDGRRWVGLFSPYRDEDDHVVLSGMEPLWGFSCPVLTANPAAHAGELATELGELSEWTRLVITGLEPHGEMFEALGRGLSVFGPVYMAEGIACCLADLSEGLEPWLERRSSRFRRQWRRWRSAASAIEFADTVDGTGLMDRLLAIEEQGWKGQDGDGITSQTMERMYRAMIDRLSERGRLRATIARVDGADVGFILGGVRAGVYRGLQLSYIESAAHRSIGHLLQSHQIRALEGTGIHTYNLGMDMEYKRRWADTVRPTTVLIVNRRD